MKTIRELRKARGLSQTELAYLVGTSQMHVSEWELRRKEPRLRYLRRLAAVLQVSIDDLDVTRLPNMATGAEVDRAPAATNETSQSDARGGAMLEQHESEVSHVSG